MDWKTILSREGKSSLSTHMDYTTLAATGAETIMGYFLGLLLGLCASLWMYEFGRADGWNSGMRYGKAVAYRWCRVNENPLCTPDSLGLPSNVHALPFEALQTLPQ